MSGASVELIIFDCDGVLVDSEVLAVREFTRVMAEDGIAVAADLWPKWFGRKFSEILGEIEAQAGRGAGPRARERVWERMREAFQAELKATPGLLAVIERLPGRRCVASSSDPERIRLSLRLTGLAPLFGEAIFSSQDVERGKPAPDIYLHAARQMGVAPERCVVVEDTSPGIRGARAAGMRAIGYFGAGHVGPDHAARLIEAGATATARDWGQVADWFAREVGLPAV